MAVATVDLCSRFEHCVRKARNSNEVLKIGNENDHPSPK